MTSAILIIPEFLLSAANAVGDAMGWGSENYTILLSSDGNTITHYACRTDVYESFFVILLAANYDLGTIGLSSEQILSIQKTYDSLPVKPIIPFGADTVIALLDINLSDVLWGSDHLSSVLLEKGFLKL